MTQNILVLGGTGNIGWPTIKNLLKHPDVIVTAGVLPRHMAKDSARFADLDPAIRTVLFDFLDPTTFPKALVNVDRVFFVRPPQLADPKHDMLPFLQAVRKQHIKQTVFVSLIGVEKNPMTPHHKIEQYIEDLDLTYTFIRPSFFMQNLSTTHGQDIREHNDLFIPCGHAKTSFIDTRDIGAVAAVALTDRQYLNQKLTITGPEAITYQQVATIMSQELNRPITYSKPSLLHFRRTMLKRGLPKTFVNVMVMLYLITQLGMAKTVNDGVEKVLDRPATSLRQFIRDHRAAFTPQN